MAGKKTIRKRRSRPHAEPLYRIQRSLFKHVPLTAQRQMEPADSFSTTWSPFDEYEVVPVELPPSSRKTTSPKRKRKPAGLVGRPRDYEHGAIAGLAEDYIRNNGLPRTQTLLREKVADACRNHKPRTIEVPSETVLKEITRPVWWRFATKRRKVRN